jgi:hypothetical protein
MYTSLLDEVYKGSYWGVKENSSSSKTRVGWVQASLLKHLAQLGVSYFNLSEAARALGVDVRRLHQAIAYLVKRSIVARLRRGWYKLLVDPWELLKAAILQGPNSSRAWGGVKENKGTRRFGGCAAAARGCCGCCASFNDVAVGLYFDNVRGVTWAGSYVLGDRGCVLGREDLGRFASISYAEVGVATGTRLMEGLGVLVVYYACRRFGSVFVCSDRIEWRPPRGFYRRYGVVDAVGVMRSRVLPYAFGLIGRAAIVVGAPFDRFRSSLYGLARQLYTTIASTSSFR